MPDLDLPTPERMMELLERALADSPADATEIAWIELRRGRETTGKRQRDAAGHGERTVQVRVRERGRTGFHRTGEAGASDLATAVREALAQARLNEPGIPAGAPPAAGTPAGAVIGVSPSPAVPAAGPAASPASGPPVLFDEEVARLDPESARALLAGLAGRGETLRLSWSEGRVAVAATGGVRRAVRATAVTLEAGGRRRPGGGRAAGAARSLALLDLAAILERARAREGPEELADPPSEGAPILLSPEAAAALLDLLNRLALASAAFAGSPLCGRLGEPVFAPPVTLIDDGTRPDGLPFPFDLSGAAKRPVDLIVDGVLRSPAVDDRLAAGLGLPPTPHAIAPDEALATNLFLLPGDRPEAELARELGDGALWIGALDPLECYEPRALRFRAVARGVRRIEQGRPGRSLPDLLWEDDLPAVLARVLATAAQPLVLPGPEPLLGGLSVPSLALARGAALRPLALSDPDGASPQR